jgi:ketosteroid isomerase-like protein
MTVGRRIWLVPSAIAWCLLAAAPAHPQGAASGRIPTVSRLVQLFSRLEVEWMDAARRGDAADLDRLVAEDFEVRTAEAPGAPAPRAAWLAASRGVAVPAPSEMAVRSVGDVAVVSCRLGGKGGSGTFVVDLWVQTRGDWKIVARYESPARDRAQPR